MSSSKECIIRNAKSQSEIQPVWWPLTQELHWNRAPEDGLTHWSSSSPSGWFVVCPKERANQHVGYIVAFVFPNSTGWIGFFCINKPYRGFGWGAQLFAAALDHYKAQGTQFVGLDAVQEQVETYKRRGFVDCAAIVALTRESAEEVPLEGGLEHPRGGEVLVPIRDVPERVLVESDEVYTGLRRERLWSQEAMWDREDVKGFALVKEGGKDELEGWVLIRGCEDGIRIGPLYANSPDRAELLLRAAMTRSEDRDKPLFAEVWPNNPETMKVFEKCGWREEGLEFRRMWLNGKVPEAQQKGGVADRQAYAMFDAGEG